MYAVIKTGGKQYRVYEKDVLQIEKIEGDEGDSVTFDEVLMIGNEKEMSVGTPTLKGASVVAELLEQTRAPKIIVLKKRRRKNSRTRNGHRQRLSTVRISKILSGSESPVKISKTAQKSDPKLEAKTNVATDKDGLKATEKQKEKSEPKKKESKKA